jgi:hypothetical protein
MPFDLQLRSAVREQVQNLAEKMKSREEQPQFTAAETELTRRRLGFFDHNTKHSHLRCASVGSGGDFPSISYGDSVIYATVARATTYETDTKSGLREIGPPPTPIFYFTLVADDDVTRYEALDKTFAALAGKTITEVIEESDYRELKAAQSRRASSVEVLSRSLIRPHAADSGNLGIQLRATSELGALLALLRGDTEFNYALIDGTLSLPLVGKPDVSLFYEHLKRLCCVEARKRGIALFTFSRSHGIHPLEWLEEIAQIEVGGGTKNQHWYLRLPVPGLDSWETTLTQKRRLPPPGAVTYLIRFHRTTPTMRLDMDREFWLQFVRGTSEAKTRANEKRIFEDLDYLTHDQRYYGYPYPIRAAHRRATLTKLERKALRKQIIETAVAAGLKRSLFRESIAQSD